MIQDLTEDSTLPGVSEAINNAVIFNKDVKYSNDHEKAYLDRLRPITAVGSTPCLLFFHGGSFVSGDKSNFYRSKYHQLILKCLRNNITLITCNYKLTNRSYDSDGYGTAIESAGDAIGYIKKSAEILQIDPENIIGMGSSAGTFIVQYFSCKERGFVENNLARSNVSLMLKKACGIHVNPTLNFFRLEEIDALPQIGINGLLAQPQFKQNCGGWLGLEPPADVDQINAENPNNRWPNDRSHLSVSPALEIMWKYDVYGNGDVTAESREFYGINTVAFEEPDEMNEYVHSPLVVQPFIDMYTNVGASIYMWGQNQENPSPSYPETGSPGFYECVLKSVEE